jgi:uncharacterized membrane protein
LLAGVPRVAALRACKVPSSEYLEAATMKPPGGPVASATLFASERIVALSDGVFSVVATLLILDVRLPPGNSTFEWAAFTGIWPQVLGYVISFLVTGQFWIAYHRKMRFVEHLDLRAIWLNLAFLMVVAFIPFATSVLSEHGNRDAVVLYALTAIVASTMLSLLWLYISRHSKWLHGGRATEEHRQERLRGLAPPLVFLSSIPIAFLDPDWAMYSWILLVPLVMLAARR